MDVGSEFSHYRVIEHIGRGGMADVWSARDKRLGRTVAIKTIARDLSTDIDPVKMFEREAQTIAALEHPHILPIYEFGEYSGQLFIVMRYVSGGSLEDVLEKGPLSLEEMMRIAKAVGQALDYAHTNKVIHLDLKPSNILLDSYQSPYLGDFGLATVLGPEGRAQNPGSGTLLYMAPEQLTADVLDHRADIYSFAILIFHMVTGQLPFDATMPLALTQLQLNQDIPDVRNVRPDLPEALNTVLRHASQLEINLRPNSIRDVLQRLEMVASNGHAAVSLDTATMPSAKASLETRQLDDLITGPIEGLISRPPDKDTRTLEIDELISGPIENLISRPVNLDEFRGDDNLISRPVDKVSKPPDEISELKIDISDLGAVPVVTPEALERREAEDIYQRARRQWARGQGRFSLGVTDYILIAGYYARAEENGLELDESGMQMLLRGALEYDHEIDFWWDRLNDESRRWTTLHALRSENAPARVRALQRLETLPDADIPTIPKLVAQALQVETNKEAKLAAVRVLDARAKLTPVPVSVTNMTTLVETRKRLSEQLRLSAVNDWRDIVYSQDIDLLLAQKALDQTEPDVAELAARTIGRIRSASAVREIATRQRKGERGALRALALVRDEAPSLPDAVGGGGRFYAWFANTLRRWSDNPLKMMWRFLLAVGGSALAMGVYVWVAYASSLGATLNVPVIWGQAVSIGITYGVFIGFVVLFGDELWQRLRGFWLAWARVIAAAVLGFVLGTLTWGAYAYLVLNDPNVEWRVMAYGGLGIAAAFVVMNLFKLPGWASFLVTFVGFYAPIFYVHAQYSAGELPVSIIYLYEFNQVYTWLIPVFVVIAVAVNAQALWKELRTLLGQLGLLKGSRA
ncbi:MAG TPA: protein kinase [Oceanobacillus sp.]|nr:protein kinase [Oceanobacillus sp.]